MDPFWLQCGVKFYLRDLEEMFNKAFPPRFPLAEQLNLEEQPRLRDLIMSWVSL